jgi:8-amino-7-oxononanoate synthase
MNIIEKCKKFYEYVEGVKAEDQYFYLRSIQSASGPRVIVNGKEMIMLASNNYLGLANDPRLKEAAIKAIEKYGAGSGGTRILSGTQELHEELEEKLAEFKGTESAVIFSSGFMANFSSISALMGKDDVIINDDKNHASIIDGCRISGAKTRFYRHNNLDKLEGILKSSEDTPGKLVIVDGVFSMDGDIANLPKIYELVKKYNALLMVDDAHATGVIGKDGRGTAEHFNMLGKVDIETGTLSKSLGGVGGFVGASKEIITYLKHNARSFIFTTSIPASAVAAVLAALEIIKKEPQLRARLWENVRIMKEGLLELGYTLSKTETPIIPVILNDDSTTFKMAGLLNEAGIFANPVIYPAVSKKEPRIRISLMASHTSRDLEMTLSAFKNAGQKLNVI